MSQYGLVPIEAPFTPVLTFATVGTFNPTYANRVGRCTRIGSRVDVEVIIEITSITLGTASGNMRVTGLPFACRNDTFYFPVGSCNLEAYTKAGAYVSAIGRPGLTYFEFLFAGSGISVGTLAAADITTGVYFFLTCHLSYMV